MQKLTATVRVWVEGTDWCADAKLSRPLMMMGKPTTGLGVHKDRSRKELLRRIGNALTQLFGLCGGGAVKVKKCAANPRDH